MEWWLKTEFGSKKNAQDTVRWNDEKRQTSGSTLNRLRIRLVILRSCEKKYLAVLVHPHHRRAGTSPMHIHLKGGGCHGGPRKQGIDQLLRNSVSYEYPFHFYKVLILILQSCKLHKTGI